MQVCRSGVDTFVIILVGLHGSARYKNDNCCRLVIPKRPGDQGVLSMLCARSFQCYDFLAFTGISCLHLDIECFKLALWPTLRQKFMNF